MKSLRHIVFGLALALSFPALGQVLQSGTVSPNHATCWVTNGVVKDCGAIAGTGTVSSVGLSMPTAVFSVTPSTITSSGAFLVSFLGQPANQIFAGPATGAGPPVFRSLVGADLPLPGFGTLGGVQALNAIAHQFVNAIQPNGVATTSSVDFLDLTGSLSLGQISDGSITGAKIQNGTITNADLANMPPGTVKGNNTGVPGPPLDLLGSAVTAMLSPFTGDSGSGGVQGLVPAPAPGDAAAGKVLGAGGNWVVGGGGGSITGPGTTTIGFVPTWGNTTGTLLTTGLGVVSTSGPNALVQTGAGGTIDGSFLPLPGASTLGGVRSLAAVAHNFVAALDPTTGLLIAARPSCSDLSDASTGCSTTVGTLATQNSTALNVSGVVLLTGLPAPVNPADAVTKSYVDSLVTTGNPHAPVAYATAAVLPNTPTYNNGTGTLTDSTAGSVLVIDGKNQTTLGTRELVQTQADPTQNGIYTITTVGVAGTTPWVLTRATDFNTVAPGNIATGAYTFVSAAAYGLTAGTANDGKSFAMNTTGTITLGVTGLNWVQISTGTTYTASAPVTLSGSVFGFQAIPATSVPANTTGGSATPSGNIVYGTGCTANTLVETGGGGTIASTCLPNPSASTLGGVRSIAAVAHQWVNAITILGVPTLSQPAFTDLTGLLTVGQLPSIGNNSVLGNVSGGVAGAVALTTTQLTTLCNVFTTTLSGCVPSPGTSTGKVLSDNGTWITAGGGGGSVSVATGLAATGNTQGTALALTSQVNAVATTPAGTGVALPTPATGQTITVFNKGNSVLAVYPPAGTSIDDLPRNTPIFIVAKSSYPFIATSAAAYEGSGATTPVTGSQWYISTTGSDANSGTSPAASWATPNHAGLTCGDTIHVASGTYSTQFQAITQTVTCPTQDNVVWLKCDTAFSCFVTGAPAVFFRTSYWGVQGFEVDGNSNACFAANPSGAATIGHVAFANNIANGCGYAGITTYTTGANSVDNIAEIGNALYNASSATAAVCGSGISNSSPRNDSTSSHLIYAAWNIAWGNKITRCLSQTATTNGTTAAGNATLHFLTSPGSGVIGFEVIDTTTPSAIPANTLITAAGTGTLTMSANAIGPGVGSGDILTLSQNSDNTGIAFDTWPNYTGVGVAENNLGIGNGTSGFELVNNSGGATVIVRYNTWASNQASPNRYGGSSANSEMALAAINSSNMNAQFNIAAGTATSTAVSGNSQQGAYWTPQDVSATSILDNNFLFNQSNGRGNLYWGNASLCAAGHTSPVGPFTNTPNAGCAGNNFTTSPAFVNPVVPGAPSCAGFPTVIACMATVLNNWKATQGIAAAMGASVAAPTDVNNGSPFLCNIYIALPPGIVPNRC